MLSTEVVQLQCCKWDTHRSVAAARSGSLDYAGGSKASAVLKPCSASGGHTYIEVWPSLLLAAAVNDLEHLSELTIYPKSCTVGRAAAANYACTHTEQ